ncbi:LysM peptidoglycan-binding domain-containing protein [Allosaccharopolyspora coralli]|uniref:LysM peptidoglycan-binding domain-containing protein n=1 Tax=Allosaccharopolyspora coralli TaxID=2665642 RepID=A0A5Q3QEW6_9PSEU|nr:transglycosylase family protein [Allosaccharopolyspora coralli]QGK70055.1 LysM peptidoglycan-binding domain-containing protein [Allosaccharopolyspora coralli]
MSRQFGKHRRISARRRSTRSVLTGTALTGAVVAAPFAFAAPANAASMDTWDQVAECESGGDWHIDTGNGYTGGLQFSSSTWSGFGGTEYASNAKAATREQQIAVAERVLQEQGPGAWPVCSKEAGLTKGGLENQDPAAGGSGSAQTSGSESSGEASAGGQSEQAPSGGGEYTVRPGDTLGTIAAQQGTSPQQLFEQNSDQLQDRNLIFPGQQLAV